MKFYTETSESSDSEEEPNTFLNSEEYVPTEEDKEYKGWRHLIPFRRTPKDSKKIPLQHAGLFSYITGCWQDGFFYQSFKKGFQKEDLHDISWHDSSQYNCEIIENLWKDEVARVGTRKASVVSTLFKMIRDRFLIAMTLCILFNTLSIVRSVYFLHQILDLIQSPGDTLQMQIIYLMLLGVVSLTRSVAFHACATTMNLAAIRARGGLLSLSCQKILHRQNSNISVGELVTLCANDGQRVYDALRMSVHIFGGLPPIIGAVYSVYLLGPWGLFGYVIFFGFFPIQLMVSRIVYKFRAAVIPFTEQRVKLMSEIITAIKFVKMYAWEKPFARKIQDLRIKEKKIIQKSLMIQSFLYSIPKVGPTIAASVTILLMTMTQHDITVTQAFVYISLLNSSRSNLAVMPHALKALAEGYHACGRIKTLLLSESKKIQTSEVVDHTNVVEIRYGSFGWEPPAEPVTTKQSDDKSFGTRNRVGTFKKSSPKSKSTEKQQLLFEEENDEPQSNTVITLKSINLSLKEGSLVGVCGAVGSGKTSLIQAILGMMKKVCGEISVNKRQKIAYVPQQAWIMNTTVKENILFGKKFRRNWYNEVVRACALLSDFDQLPAGDQTEIGERGINLSGGQKQRISMARAVYSDSDIILLDDPLSAVDAMVGQHIFQQCLKGLLANKTVLFVSHQLQFLVGCDHIIVMKDGRITEEGTHEELMEEKSGEYSRLIHTFHNSEDVDDSTKEADQKTDGELAYSSLVTNSGHKKGDENQKNTVKKQSQTKEFTDGKLTKEENMDKDKVNCSTLLSYLAAGGGAGISLLVAFFILLYIASQVFTGYWLSLWIKAGSGRMYFNMTVTVNGTNRTDLVLSDSILDNPQLDLYQGIYGWSLFLVLLFTFTNALSYMMFCLKASTTLHDQVFGKLMSSPMRFFDVTPCGQILNRFSKDIDEADSLLPLFSDQFFKIGGFVMMSIILIILAFPLFAVAMIPITTLFYLLFQFSKKGIQLGKKLDNVTKSPLFSHIATTIQGLETIQAYKMEREFQCRFSKLQDLNSVALYLFEMALRWLALRCDVLSLLIVFGTFFFTAVVPKDVLSPSLTALALTYAVTIGDLTQALIRYAIQTEARFTSVKRIVNYIDYLESEAPAIIEHRRPPTGWPEEGSIVFQEVNVRYREGLPLVLKNISFEVKPQEKIGIVGRTGSGKSSLALVLFRMMELDGGSITIDGIDISTIGLEDLRSKLSIIPQDPVLFIGTVRYNLDPFNMYRDKDLWSALRKCHVKHTIKALAGQLDAPIVENGENFSVGERQLICMARALLRQSKILVLDEATAAIDTETDSLVQETIKEVFSDCTMLTIAHRLNTITNYDRILVLDQGQVIEFDTPSALLANESSVFSQMVAVQDSQKHAAVN